MKKHQLLTATTLSFIALAFGILYATTPVAAQTNATGQGLEIAPPVITLTANPGDIIIQRLVCAMFLAVI